MKRKISSAGLLYLYINGCEKNGTLYIRQIDSYRHIEDGFYHQLMENAEVADEDEDVVHVFAVVGKREQVKIVYEEIEDTLKANVQRILSGKKASKNSRKLDKMGNIFCQCIQEFFLEQPDHFPKKAYFEYDNIAFGGICCNYLSDEEGDHIINGVVSLWMERENPALCGKQLMTNSFFMRDFVGRKVIATLPEIQTGSWRLIFEGGHQCILNNEVPYHKETLHPDDLQSFCSSNIQSIRLNPIYSYGEWFQPNDVCEDWHKVFLYLCAVSEYEWNSENIADVYEKFLKFLKENICVIMEAPAIISKEKHHAVMLCYIQQFRDFLKGNDEPVISKDMHQTLNSRYVYLPYLWSIVNPHMQQNVFSTSKLKKLIDCALSETDTYKKGTLWEDASEYVLRNITGWKITGRRIRACAQEIDLSIANCSLDDQLWQLGAYILVECKNWSTRVDIHQIRNIAHISNMKGNKTALLFATNGITEDAQAEINRLAADNICIICITAEELLQLKTDKDCKEIILNKWKCLHDKIDIADVI